MEEIGGKKGKEEQKMKEEEELCGEVSGITSISVSAYPSGNPVFQMVVDLWQGFSITIAQLCHSIVFFILCRVLFLIDLFHQ